MTGPAVSVVVPCYNESGNIPTLVARLQKVCRDTVGDSYEIVLVNDGSRDDTFALITAAGIADPHVVGVSLARNFGHQRAVSAGLVLARGERLFIVDADLQDPPELLAGMMQAMDEEGADVVYGQRVKRRGETWTKLATAAIFYRLLNALSDVKIPVDTGDFRLISRRIADLINSMPEEHRFLRGMIGWCGFKQVAFPYERHERMAGETNYPLRKMILLAIDAITSSSVRPLRLAVYFAFFGSVAGILLLGYAVLGLMTGAVRGWTSLLAVILLMGSAQLVILGVIGEYFGRLYMQSRGRPLYLIDRVVRDGRVELASYRPVGGGEKR